MILWFARIGAVLLFVNVCIFAGFALAYWRLGPSMDEEWCGCDGTGMAHIPGSKGFACEVVD